MYRKISFRFSQSSIMDQYTIKTGETDTEKIVETDTEKIVGISIRLD